MIYGLNLGSGKGWNCNGWLGLDEIGGNYLDQNSIFPYEKESIDYVYSAHFFEHVDNKTSQNLFNESYRILKPGGILRILVPDFQLMLDKYNNNDENWFFNTVGTKGRNDWKLYNIEKNLTNVFLHWVTNHDFSGPNGWARIPIRVSESIVREKAKCGDVKEFCTWAQNQIPKHDNRVKTQHINWWNLDKFENMLSEFSDVKLSKHMVSKIPDVQNGKFDNWANRKEISLYIEAVK